MRTLLLVTMLLLSGCASLTSPPVAEPQVEPRTEPVAPRTSVTPATSFGLAEHTAPQALLVDDVTDGAWRYQLISDRDGLSCHVQGPAPEDNRSYLSLCTIQDVQRYQVVNATLAGNGQAMLLPQTPEEDFRWLVESYRIDGNLSTPVSSITTYQSARPELEWYASYDERAACDQSDMVEDRDAPAGLRDIYIDAYAHNGQAVATVDLLEAHLYEIETDSEWEIIEGRLIIRGEWGHDSYIEADITLDMEAQETTFVNLSSPCSRPAIGYDVHEGSIRIEAQGIRDDWEQRGSLPMNLLVYVTV